MSAWLRSNGSAPQPGDQLEIAKTAETPTDVPLGIADIRFDSSSPVPIREQLCQAIRRAIWSHQLPPGTLLPNSRDLAQHLGVSRNTVVFTYARLVNEGLCESKTRRGTRVALDVPSLHQPTKSNGLMALPASIPSFSAAFNARHALEMPVNRVDGEIPFALFASDPALYPRTKLGRRLADKFLGAPSLIHHRPGNASRNPRFQESVAAYLRNTRGVMCDPDQVVAVSGLECALSLTARVLIDPGDSVAVEDPAMDFIHSAFSSARAQIYSIPSDSQGADPNQMKGPPARLICVTPSVSFPFGAQMSENRRLQLLAAARAQNAVVFECDSCGELRYAGARLKSLYGLDADSRVIHYGGFLQTLGTFVNVGYLVVPQSLREYFHEIGCLGTTTPPPPILDAIAEFIAENEYAAHIRTVRGVYATRLEVVKRVCKKAIPQATVSEPLGGLHVVLQFDEDFDERAVTDRAISENLPVRALSQYYRQESLSKGLVVGFGAVAEQSIPPLVRRISELIDEARGAVRSRVASA